MSFNRAEYGFFLVYLYLATRRRKYLDQINRILEVTMKNMVDDKSGWILEDFDRNWKYMHGKEDATEINIGHNIEAAWMLLRSYLLSGNEDYLKSAQGLAEKIIRYGVLNEKGVWLTNVGRTSPSYHGSDTYWWVQAYGNMFDLYLYHISKETQYKNHFQKGAAFWDYYFMDKKRGDTFFSVDTTGRKKDATKASRFKTSYHSMEQCLLNLLCLNLWVNNKPVELYFRITSSKNGEMLYPVLLEDDNIEIRKVIYVNEDQPSFITGHQNVRLPSLSNTKIKVILENPGKANK